MSTAYLTRIVEFTATHRYFRPEWSAEQNAAAFGEAAREDGHSHRYRCAVTVRGVPDPLSGMVADLALLDRVLDEEVVGRFDGRHLNRDVPEYAYGAIVPTGEMLCLDIWRRVAGRLPQGISLAGVRVEESASLYAEYKGE